MNRNRYRLVFNATLGMMVPVSETARRSGKSCSGKAASGGALALAGVLLAAPAWAELPVAMPIQSAGGGIPNFVTAGQAAYQVNGAQAFVNQVGDRSILNWQSFNVSPGHNVQFRQVDSLATNNLVQGASFTSLNRIHDLNPSVIAGSISQAAGQRANVILVNSNGIAFMGGSQVNLNSFTASSLNIADKFVLGDFLQRENDPQFGGNTDFARNTGFVKVFEGANITAGSQGRVMLVAPTVVNRGTISTPDGQAILAAGQRVYLRASGDNAMRGLLVEVDTDDAALLGGGFDTTNATVRDGVLNGQTVALTNPAEDKLGHATNAGTITAARGNVTMAGFAVNQNHIVRATSTVVANGSIYLQAKDIGSAAPTIFNNRGGRVTLGAGSSTDVMPEQNDATTSIDTPDSSGRLSQGMAQASRVLAIGQEVRVAGGASIDVPSGVVDLVALDSPGVYQTVDDPLTTQVGPGAVASPDARVHLAGGARVNVAGLDNVKISAARNAVEVELRGDELKDSPVNQQGPLRGEKAWIDLDQALANAHAGKSTLIARDSLESYQARIGRTVAERSTSGGRVNIRSQGDAILQAGALIDLSGGSIEYTPATVKTTLLSTNGRLVDLANADAETRYDGIATRFVIDHGRWNVREVIDLGQSFRFDPGYVEGKDAGTLNVTARGTNVLEADIAGRTVTGERQRAAGLQPLGAQLVMGSVSDGRRDDVNFRQRVEMTATAALLPRSFGFGDALPAHLVNTFTLDPERIGKDRLARVQIVTGGSAAVNDVVSTPQGGSVRIDANGININADIRTPGGSIELNARDLASGSANLTVADGVTLAARGNWVNDVPGQPRTLDAPMIHGGSVELTASGDVALGAGSSFDATAGAHLGADGKLAAGNGGSIALDAGGRLNLGGSLRALAPGKGGSLALKTGQQVRIGGTAAAGELALDPAFFSDGGFASYAVTGLGGLSIADGTLIAPVLDSLDIDTAARLAPSGQAVETLSRVAVRDDRVRQGVNLAFAATGRDTGRLRLGEGARVQADDRAQVRFTASERLDLLGEVVARGGTIAATLSRNEGGAAFDPASALWLCERARLDASGVARTHTDTRGLTQGTVLAGGSVTLAAPSGYVVTAAGSQIDVSGATPVRLDMPNESGGLGRMVGSDAGTLTVRAREGVMLDGGLNARAGSAVHRGGRFALALEGAGESANTTGLPEGERVVHLTRTLAPQAGGLSPGDAIPLAAGTTRLPTRVATAPVEAAGFERIELRSDALRLENNYSLGTGRAVPLRDLVLGGRVETDGSDARLAAHRVAFVPAVGAPTPPAPVAGTGTLRVDATRIDIEGLHLSGMARAEFNGSEAIQLGASGLASELRAAADLAFHGAVVAPAMAARFTLDASGHRVQFSRNTDTPIQPFSALGSLTVKANDIVQGGNLWAPFGQLDLQATNTLVFTDGSLTSVTAQPGSVLPHGQTANAREWRYAQNAVSDLPEKAIRTRAATVDMQPGANVQLAGGGDLQAREFTVGPGGGRDILADRNTYAILPGVQRSFAPADAQEGFDRAAGEAVYLSGVPGLADGVYTLLPAHYALLPGAYAVRLNSGLGEVLPGQGYTRQDGVRIAAGYVTDTRANAPRDANWQGVQVMTREQVRARSEFTLTRASNFFADSRNRPQDAGRLSVDTTGSGAQALKLDAIYSMAAAPGGRGAQVDIAALKLAVRGNAPAGFDPDAVVLDVGRLNALGAESLFLGGTRSASGDTTTLNVNADTLTIDNAGTPLRAGEILLAAKDTLEFRAGSALDAQGATGDAGTYRTDGNGAFVRAASTRAGFARTGAPDRSRGTLVGQPGSVITAASAIVLDATRDNAYRGTTHFRNNGAAVAGDLNVGANRFNFGAAPAGSEGLTYSQAELDALDLAALTLTSYSTFDLYGNVRVGQQDGNGKPLLQNLTLQGAGLGGYANAGQTAQLNARNLTLSNPAGVAYGAAPPGTGTLAITADTLTLGAGDKAIQGYSNVTVTANELLASSGSGKLDVAAPLTLNVARISGAKGVDQSLNAAGALVVASHTADRALAPVTALGAKWALQGSTVDFDSRLVLPSGSARFTATAGDVTLGANARVDVAGRSVRFFDVERPSWGGTAEFVSTRGNSTSGNVVFGAGAQVDVSAAAGGDAGTLIVRAADGTFTVVAGSLKGATPTNPAGQRGEGARADIDVGTLADFSALNTALNGDRVSGAHGFDGERSLRVRRGDLAIAAGDTVKAQTIRIALDGSDPLLADGNLSVAGALDASAGKAGRIELFARNNVSVNGPASLRAVSSHANQDGGDIVIGARDGVIRLETGSTVDVSGGAGGRGGTLTLRAARTATDVNVGAIDSTISGARDLFIEAVRVYDNINTLTATGASSGSTLSLQTITADNTAFATGHSAIKTRLGRPAARILSGVEVRSAGNLTLNNDWNLATARAGGEAGVLTLRAAGNLNLNSNLSDGFSHATPFSSGTTPATLRADDSWAYRLVAGADAGAADPLAVTAGTGDVTLAADRLVRTGTGDIRIAAGRDIRLANAVSAIYTAGKLTPPPTNFVVPVNGTNFAQFSTVGGDVALSAQGNLVGTRSTQLYSQWLFRQGLVNTRTGDYATQPAQWVRFDQFRQGVGALGGGDVRAVAGGEVREVSISVPTQHYTTATRPDVATLTVTGGGDVRVEAGSDIVGGQFYAARGALDLVAGRDIKAGGNSLATIVALGDVQASLRAQGDATLHSVIDPLLIRQTTGSAATMNATSAAAALNSFPSGHRWTMFSGYSPDSRLDMSTLTGNAILQNGGFGSYALMTGGVPTGYSSAALDRLRPANLGMTALQGDIRVEGRPVMFASSRGGLELLAADSVSVADALGMSAASAEVFPDALNPVQRNSITFDYMFGMRVRPEDRASLLHAGNPASARVYAVAGDVTGSLGRFSLDVPKSAEIRAGRDVRNFSVIAQHPDAGSVSRVLAGRDIRFDSSQRREPSRIWVGGVGRLEVEAGRDIDLGTTAGIVARGDLDNPRLPTGGLDIQLLAGAGTVGLDVAGTLARLIARLDSGQADTHSLWQARWLTGDANLTAANALAAVRGVAARPAGEQRDRVRAMVFAALRETGRDANRADSGFAGDFARGYATLALVFPGIEDKNPDGTFRHYTGDINLFASRVKTERGGNIEFMIPGGDMIVGLANTPADLVNVGNDVLGVVVAEAGNVRGFSRGDMLVNQSRILTVGGGDVLLWSSEGDVDAGKGKKTATAVPPPIIKVDAQGNVTQEFQGAVTGSGIGALALPGVTAGDVDLIAPKGTVNAGDAGIRAGNLNIAAQVVLGADNISVSGTSTGTPVADTSAVMAASTGATNAGGDVSATTAALAGNLADAARAAEELKKAFKPTFISAEVIGRGE